MPALVVLLKATKPYGHIAYTRTSKKTGKVSQVKKKGVKAAEVKDAFSYMRTAPSGLLYIKPKAKAAATLAAKVARTALRSNEKKKPKWWDSPDDKGYLPQWEWKPSFAAVLAEYGKPPQFSNAWYEMKEKLYNINAGWPETGLPARSSLSKKLRLNGAVAEYADTFVRSWVHSSTGHAACHLRGVMAAACGKKEEDEADMIVRSNRAENRIAADALPSSEERSRVKKYADGYNGVEPPPRDVVVAAIAALVEASQNAYAGEMIVTLYRGVGQAQRAELDTSYADPHNRLASFAAGVLSSWTEDEEVAVAHIGGVGAVAKIVVPVSAIVMSARAIPGFLWTEQEVVVMSSGAINVHSYAIYGDDEG